MKIQEGGKDGQCEFVKNAWAMGIHHLGLLLPSSISHCLATTQNYSGAGVTTTPTI
jgi:hypothetical protein